MGSDGFESKKGVPASGGTGTNRLGPGEFSLGPARDAAMDEFVTRTGGGIGGSNWIAPLCDYDPPINFRWPEYVTTARGRDWWIPSAGTA